MLPSVGWDGSVTGVGERMSTGLRCAVALLNVAVALIGVVVFRHAIRRPRLLLILTLFTGVALIAATLAASRIENRVAESAANPYLFLAGQIRAGLDGVTRSARPGPPVDRPYQSDATLLPRSLGEALEHFERSEFFRAAYGAEVVEWLVTLKRAEWTRYLAEISDWEHREYFSLF